MLLLQVIIQFIYNLEIYPLELLDQRGNIVQVSLPIFRQHYSSAEGTDQGTT